MARRSALSARPLDVDPLDIQVMAALSRDDYDPCVDRTPHSRALSRSAAKWVRAHDLHTPHCN